MTPAKYLWDPHPLSVHFLPLCHSFIILVFGLVYIGSSLTRTLWVQVKTYAVCINWHFKNSAPQMRLSIFRLLAIPRPTAAAIKWTLQLSFTGSGFHMLAEDCYDAWGNEKRWIIDYSLKVPFYEAVGHLIWMCLELLYICIITSWLRVFWALSMFCTQTGCKCPYLLAATQTYFR